ncbi:hypothetical protein Q9189_003200 [Teloschistes chrysophthalmus]
MAKEAPDPEEQRLKKEKKDRKEKKRAETDGVHKSSSSSKKDKPERKEKKSKKEKSADKTAQPQSPPADTTAGSSTELIIAEEAQDVEMTTKLLNTLEEEKPGTVVVKDEKGDLEVKIKQKPLIGALVPFANPLADEKVGKKVLKSVKKAKNKTIKRGVKEVVKALRKSPPSTSTSASASSNLPPGIVIIAADISPPDVISHLPVLCEDHSIPYLFLPSRAELGAAGSTKRPTSVVMVAREKGARKAVKDKNGGVNGDGVDGQGKKGEEEDWGEVYAELMKVVVKAGRSVRV